MDGLLIVDKPVGPTSHETVARVRRALRERRIGHTGTLDPAASGVLALVLGRATRLARFLTAADKTYDAVVRLGLATDTHDSQGRPTSAAYQGTLPSRETIDRALDRFRGTFEQQPPAFSAKRVNGRRSYQLARAASRAAGAAGAATEPRPAPVRMTVSSIAILAVDGDQVSLRIDCSAGFYVRSLAHELGEALGTGAHLAALRRTRSGQASLDAALPLSAVEMVPAAAVAAVVPLGRMLLDLPAIALTAEGVHRASHGLDIRPSDAGGSPAQMDRARSTVARPAFPFVRLMTEAGDLVAIATPSGGAGILHPAVVLM
jgi:tRNA pseudouridine55 synthase